MATKTNDPCRDKAADDEPIFTLRAQDLTADLFVELWADGQRFLASCLQMGWTNEAALDALTDRLQRIFENDTVNGLTRKQQEAYDCADAMTAWPTRKLAD